MGGKQRAKRGGGSTRGSRVSNLQLPPPSPAVLTPSQPLLLLELLSPPVNWRRTRALQRCTIFGGLSADKKDAGIAQTA